MQLELLNQLNFRNLVSSGLRFLPGLNLITGHNGSGKSNLLAACYLSLTADLPFGRIADAIRLGEDEAFVSSRFSHADGSSIVEIGLAPGRRLVRLDGNTVRSEQLAAVAAAVLMTPEDAQLVHGSPAGRRAWLDSLLGRISQRYARLAREYARVLTQRNALLRSGQPDSSLKVWTDQLVAAGTVIEELRVRALVRIRELAAEAYLEMTSGSTHPERRELAVTLSSEGGPGLQEALDATAREERIRGVTVVGPHRADLGLAVGGHSVQAFGSRGEARTAALALKVAEYRLLSERHGEEPVLLLDDFTAELDPERRSFLLSLAQSVPQVLATATESPVGLDAVQHLHIEAGTLRHAG